MNLDDYNTAQNKFTIAAARLLEELLADPYAQAVRDSPAAEDKYGDKHGSNH